MQKPTQPPVLLHIAYPLRRKIVQLLFARAKELQDEGTPVVLTYCDAAAGTCANNFAGSSVVCRVCKSRVRKMADAHQLPLVPVHSLGNEPSHQPIDDADQSSIEEGVQSAVTTMFRVLPSDNSTDPTIEEVKRRYQETSSAVLRGLRKVIQANAPSRLEVFNGRQACSRVAILAARRQGLPFNTLELLRSRDPILFQDHVAHDRHQIQDRMKSHPAAIDHADRYFTSRRATKNNKHAKRHSASFTPPDNSGYARTVSIFLSSQDEFEALGKDWESPFRDYARVLEEICKSFPTTLFCIRFHPNQADIASDILSPYKAIERLANVRLYYPTATINSYELMAWSDLVITFGSTVTIEACWMHKPVILLGPSFFDELDVAYTPSDLRETIKLLSADLPPKPRENAARVAHYLSFAKDPMKYVSSTPSFDTPEIPLARPLAGTVARWLENLWCHRIKRRITTRRAA